MKITHKGDFYTCLKPQNRKKQFKASNSLYERL